MRKAYLFISCAAIILLALLVDWQEKIAVLKPRMEAAAEQWRQTGSQAVDSSESILSPAWQVFDSLAQEPSDPAETEPPPVLQSDPVIAPGAAFEPETTAVEQTFDAHRLNEEAFLRQSRDLLQKTMRRYRQIRLRKAQKDSALLKNNRQN